MMKLFLLSAFLVAGLQAQTVPAHSQQAVVGLTSSWNSSTANLYLYERDGNAWRKVDGPITARLGKNGSAWGLGIHQNPKGAYLKKEGDARTPAGLFYLGGAWGYAPKIQKHPALPYRQVTSRDLWVEDSKSPYYNQHLVIKHDPKTPWEKAQQMKQNDPPHALKLFIAHNPPPKAQPNAGSAIFFHIWRNAGKAPTAGCTTMSPANLKKLIAWIDPNKKPIYILLPSQEYQARRSAWKLP